MRRSRWAAGDLALGGRRSRAARPRCGAQGAFAVDLGRPAGGVALERPIAFFWAEYGVHQSLPIYSGGLGALAGDLIEEASDQRCRWWRVGLMYRQGYFRRRLEVSGGQQKYQIDIDPERLPVALVRAQDGRPLTITVPIGGRRSARRSGV